MRGRGGGRGQCGVRYADWGDPEGLSWFQREGGAWSEEYMTLHILGRPGALQAAMVVVRVA